MANLGFTLRSTLGLIPKTDKIESVKQALQEEFEKLNTYAESDELKEYNELKELINSDEFKTNKSNILALDFKKSDEYQKEVKYNKLKKHKGIVNYYKVKESSQLSEFNETEQSDELKNYLELKEYLASDSHAKVKSDINDNFKIEKNKVKDLKKQSKNSRLKTYYKIKNSSKLEMYNSLTNEAEQLSDEELKADKKYKSYIAFKNSQAFSVYNEVKDSDELTEYEQLNEYINSNDYKQALESLTYKNTDEYKKEEQFASLKKSNKIVHWEKFQKSKPYLLFKEIEDSDILKEYEELDEFINSDKFKEYKEYMLDKEKWKKTDDFNKEVRLQELEKSDDIKWYLATQDSKKFDELKAWNITFEDDFTSGKVDETKWMNSFFWGKMNLNDRYVIAGEKQYYTDNKNFEINGTTLKIVTKKEDVEGKVWHPMHGFAPQKFSYTSGMLSTAHSFRQQYGKIEAKIKLNAQYPIYQAFWLKGEKILPEIDVFKFNMDKKNRLQLSTITGDPMDYKNAKANTNKLNGSTFTKDYFIYTVDWEENQITWKINGIEVYSTTENIPNEPLYLMLSSGLISEPKEELQNNAFEIDWVRCYERAN